MPSQAHQTVDLHAVSPAEVESSLLSPDASMLVLTWVTFFLLLAVLYKFAWKPILAALDTREESIRKSLEDAERIKGEVERLNETRAQMMAESEERAKDIIDQSRKAATEAAKVIEGKIAHFGEFPGGIMDGQVTAAAVGLEEAYAVEKVDCHRPIRGFRGIGLP